MRVFGLALLFVLTSCQTPLPVAPAPVEGEMCGGIMGAVCSNAAEYCRTVISAQCGAADQTGICSVKPEICTMDFNPVCGCDGKTYSNECVANSKGISAAYAGSCKP